MKTENMPTTTYPEERWNEGIDLITLLCDAKLAQSRSDARRNITQGGVSVNEEKCTAFDRVLTKADFQEDGTILIKKGKKNYHLFRVEGEN